MKNLENTLASLKIAKKYWKMIEDISIGDGYWITLKNEYCWDDQECHTIHEYTLADMKACLREVRTVEEMDRFGDDIDAFIESMMIKIS